MNSLPCFAVFDITSTVKPISLNFVAIFRNLDDAQTYVLTNSTKTLLIKQLTMSDEELVNLISASTKSISYNFCFI